MKSWSVALVALVPIVGGGCGFTRISGRNVVIGPLYTLTDQCEHHDHQQMAREAYLQMAMCFSDQQFSCDYRRGFVDGFVDFLDFGGVGEPPPVPPPTYRLVSYETPEGLAAMADWKNGFRHGAATAQASNLRKLVTLPVFWGPVYPTTPTNPPRKKEAPVEVKSPPPAPPEPGPEKIAEPPKPMEPIRPQ